MMKTGKLRKLKLAFIKHVTDHTRKMNIQKSSGTVTIAVTEFS